MSALTFHAETLSPVRLNDMIRMSEERQALSDDAFLFDRIRMRAERRKLSVDAL
jgi:hypothetical protein